MNPRKRYGMMTLIVIAFIITAPLSVPLALVVLGMIAAAIVSDRRLLAQKASAEESTKRGT